MYLYKYKYVCVCERETKIGALFKHFFELYAAVWGKLINIDWNKLNHPLYYIYKTFNERCN